MFDILPMATAGILIQRGGTFVFRAQRITKDGLRNQAHNRAASKRSRTGVFQVDSEPEEQATK